MLRGFSVGTVRLLAPYGGSNETQMSVLRWR